MATHSEQRVPRAILVRQPDGSLAQACPPGYVEAPAPRTPPEVEQLVSVGHSAGQHAEQLEKVADRSRRVLQAILLAGFFLEVFLAARHASAAANVQPVVQQVYGPRFAMLHPSDPRLVALVLLLDAAYGLTYYYLGLRAVAGRWWRALPSGHANTAGAQPNSQTRLCHRRKARCRVDSQLKLLEIHCRRFARRALLGALLQPLLAVAAGKLSVSIMFLRLAAYSQATVCSMDARVAAVAGGHLHAGRGSQHIEGVPVLGQQQAVDLQV
eukprot:TRINITY_DN35810_c0_g1_i1.p1 TRINITY_DN35810_c0_g1~~TRINITY_DN35810_c0_g1_i1.p1  ORF type:complete len:269 (-),score=51.37 TRINITY_DN35810_c0_g1_i1:63-869(-)